MLQSQLEGTGEPHRRRTGRFNDAARDYNSAIKRVPAVFFAAAFGFKDKALFPGRARNGAPAPPAVQFDFGGKPAPAKP